ncbi:DUF5347 family protein [Serratia marcescens]|uniref:DUF5347 family protein n=1 Tax=Serratia marcescens TaxID=615 RepID=UPI0009A4BC5D|nr:DUF5347 family protein [Serratia marcescens]OPJ97323.1 hypothetical protein B1H39_02100 [Serratia marcescens]CAI1547852.1 Uncharacterised protein [Serratia marcescens]
MAFTKTARTVPLTPSQRADGLQHIAELRRDVFKCDSTAEINRFLADVCNESEPRHKDNIRTLSAILFLAGIKKERHGLSFSELTSEEKKVLVDAMNKFRAVVSLFPKHLSMLIEITF